MASNRRCMQGLLVVACTLPPASAVRGKLSLEFGDDARNSSRRAGRFTCPQGLTMKGDYCEFREKLEELLPEEDESVFPDSTFQGVYNTAPVAFELGNEFYDIEREYKKELEVAFGHEAVDDVADRILANVKHHHGHKHSELAADLHFAHELIHEPGHMGVHMGVEHAALHGVAHGLEHAAHMMVGEAGHGIAHATAAGAVEAGGGEAVAWGIAAGVAEGTADVLAGPIAFIPGIAVAGWKMAIHERNKDLDMTRFAKDLVIKSECVRIKASMQPNEVEAALHAGEFLDPSIQLVCGKDPAVRIGKQLQRTSWAVTQVMKVMREVGGCLYSHDAARRLAKRDCTSLMYEYTRLYEGEPGIINQILLLLSSYGAITDDLLQKPFYEALIHDQFEVRLPKDQRKNGVLIFQQLAERLGQADANQMAASNCVGLLATSRAYERTFLRLSVALQAYVRSYAKEHFWIYRTSFHACGKVFVKIGDDGQHEAHGEYGLCKEKLQFDKLAQDAKEDMERIKKGKASRKDKAFNEKDVCEYSIDPSLWPDKAEVECETWYKHQWKGKKVDGSQQFNQSRGELSPKMCQVECEWVEGCEKWTWWPELTCELFDKDAELKHTRKSLTPNLQHGWESLKAVSGLKVCTPELEKGQQAIAKEE
eukprot:TRINITY_DN23054_c0_g2_i1.p1 TRINITY_DN23054_c0_g2~~TRINITY_DN23054_c0_g2_i1.p1  ORF type:complete len:651 (+),score=183.77 TRINITY_DN23054_c0_g2_i1:95-2047(+)